MGKNHKNKRKLVGCSGKVGHKKRRFALIALRKVNHAQMDVYQCRHCGKWHLGKSDRPWHVQARLDQLLGVDETVKEWPQKNAKDAKA